MTASEHVLYYVMTSISFAGVLPHGSSKYISVKLHFALCVWMAEKKRESKRRRGRIFLLRLGERILLRNDNLKIRDAFSRASNMMNHKLRTDRWDNRD